MGRQKGKPHHDRGRRKVAEAGRQAPHRRTDTASPSQRPSSVTHAAAVPRTTHGLTLLCLGLIVLATVVAFGPATDNEFLYWDDDNNLMLNVHIRTYSSENLGWMWTARLLGVWQPLTWMVTAIEYQAFGGDDLQRFSRGMHQASIALHAVASILVFFLTRRLITLGAPKTAVASPYGLTAATTIAAVLFAVHPLRVETTAWASGQAYILALIPAIAATLCYLQANTGTHRRRLWHVLAVLFLTASLLCKAMAVPMVAVLLVLDVYPLRRFGGTAGWDRKTIRPVLMEKIPYAAVTLVAIGLNIWATTTTKTYQADPIATKIFISAFCILFYVGMTFVPVHPAPYYMKPQPFDASDPWFVGSALLFIAVTVALVLMRRRWPWLLATWCVYVLILLPVVGLIQHGGQMAADRYTYLSCIGWFILIGAGVLRLWAVESTPLRRAVRVGICVAAVVFVGVLSQQSRAYCLDWKDSEAVWSAMIRRNPSFAMGYYNLAKANKRPCEDLTANAKREQAAGNQTAADALNEEAARRYARAEANFRAAIKLYPLYPKANVDLANMMMNRQVEGGWSAAEQHYLTALQGEPDFYMAHLNLGRLRMLQKRFAEAEQHFIRAEQDARQRGEAKMLPRIQQRRAAAQRQLGR